MRYERHKGKIEINVRWPYHRACAAFLVNSRWLKNPAFATHNTRTVADVLAMTSLPDFTAAGCEFQRLHGMG